MDTRMKLDGFKKTLISLALLFCLLFGPTLLFLGKGNEVAAAVTGTLTAATVLAFTHVLAFAGGAWYTKGAMQAGADVALRAQETNDRWDERKTASFARVMQEGARIGRMGAGTGDHQPALPLPSQDIGWLPPVAQFHDIDME